MQQCSKLEHEERVMVEKLNQTRMSALSAQSHNRKLADERQEQTISVSAQKSKDTANPFKQERSRADLHSASVKKPSVKQNMLVDDRGRDPSDKVEYDGSLKIGAGKHAKRLTATGAPQREP